MDGWARPNQTTSVEDGQPFATQSLVRQKLESRYLFVCHISTWEFSVHRDYLHLNHLGKLAFSRT